MRNSDGFLTVGYLETPNETVLHSTGEQCATH